MPNKNIQRAHVLLAACIIGALVGIVFIMVQPLFGMDTLTSRHAAAYQKLGNWNSSAAITIAWIAHMAISVFYGLLIGIVMLATTRLRYIAMLTLIFSWLTTIIAPPANAIIVQLVSWQKIHTDQLPDLNFNVDAKFVLHLLFFMAIVAALKIYQNRVTSSNG
ncbi:hypothetical protein [Gilvimarinus polysaccharolyticus]|uniref:hypothetical protein n=1 Tax=Gilvimarinus polysaccharolyticus TaxID=863921 RepID=UPI000673858B|nr:hypothetical protein [Gilvimarinus polysaccharolyticus]